MRLVVSPGSLPVTAMREMLKSSAEMQPGASEPHVLQKPVTDSGVVMQIKWGELVKGRPEVL